MGKKGKAVIFKGFSYRCYKLKEYIIAVLEIKFLHRQIEKKRWAGKKLLTQEQCNRFIENAIHSKKPFMAARFGFVEFGCIINDEKRMLNIDFTEREREKCKEGVNNNAGMFSNDNENYERFVKLYLKEAQKCDLLGVWFQPGEEYLLKNYLKETIFTKAKNLEPYYYEEGISWSSSLKNKKVLVVHPFAESVKRQYSEHREKIWAKEDVLPEFELITFKAVQTICGEKDERFATWFEALEYMTKEIEKIDFDVAIIGCGAYGLPLAAAIKDMGKQAIHLGGAVQVLFGIRGKRWDGREFFQKHMNEYWIRPNDGEKPEKASEVEGGCYW